MLQRFFTLTLGFMCSISLLQAQVLTGKEARQYLSDAKMLRFQSFTTAPTYLALTEKADWKVKETEAWVKKALHLRGIDGLRKVNEHTDKLGQRHQRFYQTYQGYTVEGSMYLVHSLGDKIVSMNGDYFAGIDIEPNFLLSENQALAKALAYTNAQVYEWQAEQAPADHDHEQLLLTAPPKAEIVLVPVKGDFKNPVWRFAYKFNVYALEPLSREYVFVDAENGKVIYTQNLLHSSNVPGTAVTKYSGTQPITTDSTGVGQYRLRRLATATKAAVTTRNVQTGTNTNTAVDFTDSDNYWNNVNPQKDEVATDVHWGAEMVFDYYKNNFNRNSIDDNGMPLRNFVHYDVNYFNAFWNGQQATFGDGSGSPLTGLDVVAHEFTHGITGNTAQLIYQYESGALNESFSDIFGTAIEFFARPATANWLIGENSPPPGGGFSLRSMENPNAEQQPDTYLGQLWATGPGDNGGVHINSGVQNFWFYLLCQGGTGTNDIGNAYTVNSIGMSDAQDIAYRNLSVYLTPSSQYDDAVFYSKLSTYDLFGACSPQAEAVINAWYAVGIGNPYQPQVMADFETSKFSFCETPVTISFDNLSNNATAYSWDFGDGTGSTANFPTHTYTSFGDYTVTLLASDTGCGSDTITKTAYISIQFTNPCVLNIDDTTLPNAWLHCEGTLFDSGGEANDYSEDEDNTVTISPANAYAVTLTFLDFNLATPDKLTIYDGNSTAAPIIGVYTGTILPNVNGIIQSTGSSITLKMETNDTQNSSGFKMNWKCLVPSSLPVTAFTVNKQTTCDGNVQFTNNSQFVNVGYLWDFGDGNTSTQKHPLHTYLNNGTYTVKLTATNTLGVDSLIEIAYVTVNRPILATIPPVAICGTGSAQLTGQGSELHWFAMNGNELAVGNTFNTPNLSTSTSYQVQDFVWNPSQYVGPVTNTSVGTGGFLANDMRYPIFDVTQPCILRSFLVYSQTAGACTFEYYNSFGLLKASKTVNLIVGENRIPLGFKLEVGAEQYVKKTINTPSLYRNNNGAVYPYNLSNYVNITGNSAGSGNYYFYFYDWEISDIPCTSPIQTLNVFVGTGAAPNPSFTYTNNGLTYQFNNTSTGANGAIWNFGDGNYSAQINPTHTYANAGNYTVTLTALKNGCGSDATTNLFATSLEESLLQEPLQLFPNPNKGSFEVKASFKQSETIDLVVYNTLGQKVYQQNLGKQSQLNQSINLTHLPQGTYYLQVKVSGQMMSRKYVKE
ncbi:MAG: M4 family metallopeptidase [Bacteroidia bacterium]